jgi:predicted RNA-binding protein with RPS1 domain
MAFEIGSSVTGEVSAIVAEGVIVVLSEGRTGFASTPAGAGTREGSPLRVGDRVTARILAHGPEGRFELVILPHEERPADAFDREFHRLKSVLKGRSSKLASARASRERLPEEEVEKWVAQSEAGLSRLRDHRAQRLAEAFYDDEGEGGADAKRDSARR